MDGNLVAEKDGVVQVDWSTIKAVVLGGGPIWSVGISNLFYDEFMILPYGFDGDAIDDENRLSTSHSTKYLEIGLPPSNNGGSHATPNSVRETTSRVTFVGPDGCVILGLIFFQNAA